MTSEMANGQACGFMAIRTALEFSILPRSKQDAPELPNIALMMLLPCSAQGKQEC